MHQNIQRIKNEVILLKIPMYYIQKNLFSQNSLVYILIIISEENELFFLP